MPLSLIGTFGVMYLAGFSVNNLTLMALTIATGFVVDDAIVMLENIARHLEEGETPLQAALKGARQIGFTLISLTFSLIAVLIPLLFMADVVGRLFREFAITLAVAILISLVVSLTLTPMMCARLLKHEPEEKQSRFYRASGAWIDGLIARYDVGLQWVLRHQPLTLLVAVATLGLTVVLYADGAQGLLPGAGHRRDPGHFRGAAERFPSRAMSERQQRLAAAILDDPAVASLSSYIGVDGDNATLNSGRLLINLKPHAERDGHRQSGDRAAAPASGADARHRAVPAAGAGPDHRGPGQPHAVPVQPGIAGRRIAGANGRPGWCEALSAQAGTARRGQRPAEPRPAGLPRHRSRRRRAPRA